jgi:PAS domain S-box-containing protein
MLFISLKKLNMDLEQHAAALDLSNSELKQAETELLLRGKSLANSERFLKTIIDTEPECIKMLDANCNLLMMNSAGLSMIDADSLEQVKGHCICPLVTSHYRDAFVALTKQVFQGIPGKLEFETVGLKGRHVWLETHAVPFRNEHDEIVSLLGITRDITERKRAEEELELKNVILSTQQETSIDGILVVDENDTIISYNRRFSDLWEIPHELVESKGFAPVLELVAGRTADPESYMARVKYLYEHKEEKSLEEVFLKDGRVFDRYSATMRGNDGKYYGRVWYLRDITERKRMEEELRKAHKLESLGVLAGGIAHDFNNLLTGILGNISLAKIMTDPDSKTFKRLDEAEKAVWRSRDLTKQLMTFSKGGAPVKKTASMEQIVKDSASFVLRGSNVRCDFAVSEHVWPVEVDEGQMNQVINNLIINADQSMVDGGIIEIGIENLTVAPENEMSLKEGLYVKITIRDHGAGIPEEYLHKIFDPYFTTKQKGSGLGLASVYSIIKNHNGYVGVESKVGVGTTFQVYIPASENGLSEATEIKENPHAGSGRILVMDDEEIIREVAAEILRHLGYCVVVCSDGSEAIELYRQAFETKEPFAAVIMDLTVPGRMGGKEAAARILEIEPDAVLIVSSGYSSDPVLANFRQYGFSGVVPKPFDAEGLASELKRLIHNNC